MTVMTAPVQKTTHHIQAQAVVASTMILVSFSMLFATLLLGYVLYRTSASVWPPGGMSSPSLFWPILSTGAVGLSSLFLVRFQKSLQKCWLTATIGTGVLFLFTQLSFWKELKNTGIQVDTSIYSSIVYGLTWIHGGHIVLGLLGLIALWGLFPRRQKHDFVYAHMIVRFWHFLGIVWSIMFIALFIV